MHDCKGSVYTCSPRKKGGSINRRGAWRGTETSWALLPKGEGAAVFLALLPAFVVVLFAVLVALHAGMSL